MQRNHRSGDGGHLAAQHGPKVRLMHGTGRGMYLLDLQGRYRGGGMVRYSIVDHSRLQHTVQEPPGAGRRGMARWNLCPLRRGCNVAYPHSGTK